MSEFEAQDFGTEPVKAEREGLPSGYRMRADSHYVDLISSGGRAERARSENRAVVRDADTPLAAAPRPLRDRRVFDHLAEEVAAIQSAAAMLMADPSPLARRVSLDLIKAQTARASWLLRAQAFVSGPAPDLAPKSRPVAAMLADLRDRLAAECRLVGVGLHVASDATAVVSTDEGVVALGVTGAVMALLPLLSGTESPVIRIEAIVQDDGDEDDLQAIEISQDTVTIPPTAKLRFFEAEWVDRPGGWLAATGATVAQAAAERLGGRVSLATGNRRGCTIRIGFE